MNRTEFLLFIEHPENMGSVSLTESEKVLSKFPYWQSARLIFVKALQQQQHFSFDSQLKLAAIYAGNRSKLFELINRSEGERESGSSNGSNNLVGHPERSRRSAEEISDSSQLAIDNKANEIENDLIAIEKTEEPFLIEEPIIEEPTETPDENIIATENVFSENIEILTTESNVEEPIEIPDEKIITIENSLSENVETLTDKKEEDFNESENDLSKIIEQRIKELTDQNSSYSKIKNQDLITENNFENELSLTDENIPIEIENNVSDKDSFEDETVSIEEEMAAIDVYEETTIADDVFNNDSISVISTPEITVNEETETPEPIKTDSSQHSFLDWFKFLKVNEGEGESGNTLPGHPERSRRSAVGGEESSSSNPDNYKEEGDDRKNEIEIESKIEEGSIMNINSDEPLTSNLIPIAIGTQTSNENAETLNAKPQTSNLIDKFIEEDPRIQPKKNAFFSPSVAARKSVEYDDEVVSETLAEIFYKQQLYDKALKAYEKLTLMFPEKSTLFAARIKKIKEESKSGK